MQLYFKFEGNMAEGLLTNVINPYNNNESVKVGNEIVGFIGGF